MIVGQGLAGTVLSYFLKSLGKTIAVVDHHHHKSSSIIAAGTFNPAVFRRLGLIWKAQELIDFSIPFYKNLESEFSLELVRDMDIYKVLSDNREKDTWNKLAENTKYKRYFKSTVDSGNVMDTVRGDNGLGVLGCSGTVNLGKLLSAFRKTLVEGQELINERFDFKGLKRDDKGHNYKGIDVRKIIFCEGHQAINNPYFSWLPFKLTKGEILHVETSDSPTEKILHKRINMIPLNEQNFWAGATFEWDFENDLPTEKGKVELNSRVEALIGKNYKISNHIAGIRPTVSDRRPLLGQHPIEKDIYIFNGLGTRGVLIAPYFASQMADYLEKNGKLDVEVDIKRYESAYQG